MNYLFQLVSELLSSNQLTHGVMQVLWEVIEDRQQPDLARILRKILKETLFEVVSADSKMPDQVMQL